MACVLAEIGAGKVLEVK